MVDKLRGKYIFQKRKKDTCNKNAAYLCLFLNNMSKELSLPLDVHRWSEYPEVKNFVNLIYEEHFRWQNPNLIKKHLKVALLDLYVAWNEHPDMKIGVHMNRNAYKAKSLI